MQNKNLKSITSFIRIITFSMCLVPAFFLTNALSETSKGDISPTLVPNVKDSEYVTLDTITYKNKTSEVAGEAAKADNWLGSNMPLLKDVVQIVFYITIAVVTVLTYIGAKRTILQPLRTEIFKRQLDELSHIVNMFYGKEEIALREDFGFDELFTANCTHVVDRYAKAFFDIDHDRDSGPYSKAACPSAILQKKAVGKEIVLLDGDYKSQEQSGRLNNDQLKENWKINPTGGILFLPHKFVEMEDSLRKLTHPLLPQSVSILINDYLGLVRDNVILLSKTLDECSGEFQEKYPSIERLEDMSFNSIRSKYIRKLILLKPKSDNIIMNIRKYLDVDNILKPEMDVRTKK